MRKALIAMSGGVDSSVAAFLTRQAGYDCIGVTMRLCDNAPDGDAVANTCCSLDDVEDARSVARKLGMPFYAFNYKEAFREKVIDKFVRCYECGLTPNPCIDCNRHLKFDCLLRRGFELGCDCVVTGHYAQIRRDAQSGRYILYRAADLSKDQSYVLYTLTQEQLAHTRFPLGALSKAEARAIAEAQGFVNARKHDSQDICFVPDGDYVAFMERERITRPVIFWIWTVMWSADIRVPCATPSASARVWGLPWVRRSTSVQRIWRETPSR